MIEEFLISLLQKYGYVILLFWSMLEGETGLIMAGILSHTGDMDIVIAICVASTGAFIGDQIYFYIGRYNKKYINKLLRKKQKYRKKFAIANLLIKKYGWPLIFIQRYFYGLRTVIPMCIGLTKYSPKNFAIINACSSVVWAMTTIVPSYILGDEILNILKIAKKHWYYAAIFIILIIAGIWYIFHRIEKKLRLRIRNDHRVKSNRKKT